MNAAGSLFSSLSSAPLNESCNYELNECKQFCEEMGSACLGINYGRNAPKRYCVLQVRSGVTMEDAKASVPKFCSNPWHEEFKFNGSGLVVRSTNYYGWTCMAYQRFGTLYKFFWFY